MLKEKRYITIFDRYVNLKLINSNLYNSIRINIIIMNKVEKDKKNSKYLVINY